MDRGAKTDQNNFFTRITEMIPFGILLINPGQEIEYHNKPFDEMFGSGHLQSFSFSQWLNTAFPNADNRKQARGILLFEIPFTQAGEKRTYATPVTTNQGQEKYVQFTSLKLDNTGFLIVCNDISDERKREADLQRTQIMEAIGSMAGGVTHEFNNILMGIQGYISLMLMDTLPSDPQYSKLKAIEAQIKNGSMLTEQLLERARGGKFELKTVDLNEFIAGVASLIGRSRNDIHISELYSTYVWAVEADISLLEQAFQSIFANAAGVLPGGGSLLLKTDNFMLEESHVARHGIKPGPYVRISLTLPEVWIDESAKQQMFSPSSILKDEDRSTGLDLSLAYGMIKSHEGMIEVESDPLTGLAFHVYLPASSKTPHKKKQEFPAAKTLAGNETILLVDDEQVITEVTGSMLAALGYDVIIASDGEEAVAIYQERGDHIDLVIMDIVMPIMGGGEAIDLIRAINPSARVILCSGYSMSGAVKAIMDKGVRTFLKKPFKLDEFSRIIREVLDS
ncbi:MAG: response regulator [Deltaproteobacteria bacterium]